MRESPPEATHCCEEDLTEDKLSAETYSVTLQSQSLFVPHATLGGLTFLHLPHSPTHSHSTRGPPSPCGDASLVLTPHLPDLELHDEVHLVGCLETVVGDAHARSEQRRETRPHRTHQPHLTTVTENTRFFAWGFPPCITHCLSRTCYFTFPCSSDARSWVEYNSLSLSHLQGASKDLVNGAPTSFSFKIVDVENEGKLVHGRRRMIWRTRGGVALLNQTKGMSYPPPLLLTEFTCLACVQSLVCNH